LPVRISVIVASRACACRRGRTAQWSDRASIDRFGGDYRNFDLKRSDGDEACKAALRGDNKCRAWTYARRIYRKKMLTVFLKKEIKPPRRQAGGFISGVVR